MQFSNSPLTVYQQLSPYHSGPRPCPIDRITPHCAEGKCTVLGFGEWFSSPDARASSNYGVDAGGNIGMYVEEGNVAWCSSDRENDERAVTIECASDPFEPYAMSNAVYGRLILLCVDVCRRNGRKKLLWIEDREKALQYVPAPDEMLLTVHRWFCNKACPGEWLYSRLDDLAKSVTLILSKMK